jgi:hypothetical protein
VIIVIFALGSIGDYPLRSPSLACVFVVAALWLSSAKGGINQKAVEVWRAPS